ncbi:MAG: hypothetical protein GYA15_13765 [Leptolinea sp.]|nr:hypothetical protein [Leptolinea sp.]
MPVLTYAPVIHYLKQTTIRRSRLLPVPGRVLVSPGQKVSGSDAVAEAINPTGHFFMDVRSILKVDTDTAGELIQRKKGEHLAKGDILAETGGEFSRVVRAPIDCEITEINSGVIIMETRGEPLQVRAGLPGFVRELNGEFGVVVESGGALVQGVWGNDLIGAGLLVMLCEKPDEELTLRQLEASARGSVAVAGYCLTGEAIRMAAELELQGLILSSINPELMGLIDNLHFPIMLIEGFGKIPMNSTAFSIFHELEKRDAAIHARQWDQTTGDRPEVLIPFQTQALQPPEVDEFAPGQIVHVKLPPFSGEVGTILGLNAGMTQLSNGLRAPTAVLRKQNGDQITVPLANLDLIM